MIGGMRSHLSVRLNLRASTITDVRWECQVPGNDSTETLLDRAPYNSEYSWGMQRHSNILFHYIHARNAFVVVEQKEQSIPEAQHPVTASSLGHINHLNFRDCEPRVSQVFGHLVFRKADTRKILSRSSHESLNDRGFRSKTRSPLWVTSTVQSRVLTLVGSIFDYIRGMLHKRVLLVASTGGSYGR